MGLCIMSLALSSGKKKKKKGYKKHEDTDAQAEFGGSLSDKLNIFLFTSRSEDLSYHCFIFYGLIP